MTTVVMGTSMPSKWAMALRVSSRFSGVPIFDSRTGVAKPRMSTPFLTVISLQELSRASAGLLCSLTRLRMLRQFFLIVFRSISLEGTFSPGQILRSFWVCADGGAAVTGFACGVFWAVEAARRRGVLFFSLGGKGWLWWGLDLLVWRV